MPKINLCCGMDYREGYINIDFSDIGSDGEPIKVDKYINLLSDQDLCFFFFNDSVEEVIFHESLEHFNRWNGLKILKDIYQVMKPGGVLSLTVPNAERQLRILLTKMSEKSTMDDFLRAHEKFSYWKWHDDLMGAAHESDGMDGDSHKTLYTVHSLRSILEHVGFKIEKFDVDSSLRVIVTK